MAIPTKSVPGGCLIGLAGLASWIYAAICGFILYRIWKLDQIAAREELFRHLSWHAGIASIAGLLLLILGWRLAMKTGSYDHSNPSEPRMKF